MIRELPGQRFPSSSSRAFWPSTDGHEEDFPIVAELHVSAHSQGHLRDTVMVVMLPGEEMEGMVKKYPRLGQPWSDVRWW